MRRNHHALAHNERAHGCARIRKGRHRRRDVRKRRRGKNKRSIRRLRIAERARVHLEDRHQPRSPRNYTRALPLPVRRGRRGIRLFQLARLRRLYRRRLFYVELRAYRRNPEGYHSAHKRTAFDRNGKSFFGTDARRRPQGDFCNRRLARHCRHKLSRNAALSRQRGNCGLEGRTVGRQLVACRGGHNAGRACIPRAQHRRNAKDGTAVRRRQVFGYNNG